MNTSVSNRKDGVDDKCYSASNINVHVDGAVGPAGVGQPSQINGLGCLPGGNASAVFRAASGPNVYPATSGVTGRADRQCFQGGFQLSPPEQAQQTQGVAATPWNTSAVGGKLSSAARLNAPEFDFGLRPSAARILNVHVDSEVLETAVSLDDRLPFSALLVPGHTANAGLALLIGSRDVPRVRSRVGHAEVRPPVIEPVAVHMINSVTASGAHDGLVKGAFVGLPGTPATPAGVNSATLLATTSPPVLAKVRVLGVDLSGAAVREGQKHGQNLPPTGGRTKLERTKILDPEGLNQAMQNNTVDDQHALQPTPAVREGSGVIVNPEVGSLAVEIDKVERLLRSEIAARDHHESRIIEHERRLAVLCRGLKSAVLGEDPRP